MLDNIKFISGYLHTSGVYNESYSIGYVIRTAARFTRFLFLGKLVIAKGRWDGEAQAWTVPNKDTTDIFVSYVSRQYTLSKDNTYAYKINTPPYLDTARHYHICDNVPDLVKNRVSKEHISFIVNNPHRAAALDVARNNLIDEVMHNEAFGVDVSAVTPMHERFGFKTQKAYKQFVNYLNNDVDVSPWFEAPVPVAA